MPSKNLSLKSDENNKKKKKTESKISALCGFMGYFCVEFSLKKRNL